MKKYLFFTILILVMVFTLYGCVKADEPLEGSITEPATEPVTEPATEPATEPVTEPATEPAEDYIFDEEWIAQNKVIPDVIPEFEQGDMVILPTDEFYTHGIYFTSIPLYRSRYYDPGLIISAVPIEEWKEFKNIFMKPDRDAGVQPDEMYLVTAIKYFKLSREDCEKAIDYWWSLVEERNHYDGTERYEIPNLDIIYTFDNEIINNYYLRNQ